MRKKAGALFVILGAVLILSALLLLFHNRQEDDRAGQESESLLVSVKSAIDDRGGGLSGVIKNPENEEEEAPLDPNLPVVDIEGYGYIGYLSVPALEIELPVMAEWDYNRLEKAPCRQFGSSRTDDLVIAAHNYLSHFGELGKLQAGDSVVFTDMDGIANTYKVASVETLKPTAVEEVQNSGHDIVLYTCTKGGRTRITVFCDRAEE